MTPSQGASAHAAAHVRLIEQVACGDLDLEHEELRLVVATCAHCRRELDELRVLRDLLAADAAAERAALAPALESPAAVDPRILALTRQLARQSRRQQPRRVMAACAAALVLCALSYLVAVRPPRAAEPILLMGASIKLLAPAPDGVPFQGFRWAAELPRGGSYHLQVWAADGDPDAPPLLDHVHLATAEYHPNAAELARFPDRIIWRIEAWDINDTVVATSARTPAHIRDDGG